MIEIYQTSDNKSDLNGIIPFGLDATIHIHLKPAANLSIDLNQQSLFRAITDYNNELAIIL